MDSVYTHTRTLCCLKKQAGYLMCTKVTCVKPLSLLHVQVALLMWGFVICYSHWSWEKFHWAQQTTICFAADFNLIRPFSVKWNKMYRIDCIIDKIAVHFKHHQYFAGHLAAFQSIYKDRGAIFISHPSFHTIGSSDRADINTSRGRGVQFNSHIRCECGYKICAFSVQNVGQSGGGRYSSPAVSTKRLCACQGKLKSLTLRTGSHTDLFSCICSWQAWREI